MRSVALALVLVAAVMAGGGFAHTIKHIVVVMEENRSFDHLFGWAGAMLGIDGLTGVEYNRVSSFNASSEKIYVTRDAPFVAECDPQHLLFLTTPKIFGVKNWLANNLTQSTATMGGFIEVEHDIHSKDNCRVLDMFPPERMPVLTGLAKQYAIMDKFYCSVPGPTWPNRQFAMAATSGGSTETFNWYRGQPGNLFPQKTFFDQVAEAGGTWRNYYVDTPWELFMKTLAENPDNIQPMEEFRRAAAAGELPTYSFINPRAAVNVTTGAGSNDMHPDHDVRLAEAFVNEVYETVRASPSWNDTLLIVTFDEHGGFYDHVVPPMDGIPVPDNSTVGPDVGFVFDRLGIRIPTILISPWIEAGTVISEPPAAQMPTPTSHYDLTSIMATARKLLPNMSQVPPLTKRDAWAATFEHVLASREGPRGDCPTTMAPPGVALKTTLTPEEAAREAAQPVNGLQRTMLETVALLHGLPPHHVDAIARRSPTQGEIMREITALHDLHRTHTKERATLGATYSVWMTSMMQWYWLFNVGKSHFDLTHASNVSAHPSLSADTVTIAVRGLETAAGQRYCLDYRSNDNNSVGVSPCNAGVDPTYNNAANQQWEWRADATVRPTADQSLCLTTAIWNGTKPMSVQPCANAVTQHFAYQGAAPGNSPDGRIQFGNGVYTMGVVPFASAAELELLLQSKGEQ